MCAGDSGVGKVGSDNFCLMGWRAGIMLKIGTTLFGTRTNGRTKISNR